jgi:beta-phosphoglucomutase
MKISAVIFDLNGTILEDEDEYGKAFNKVLKSLGVDSKSEYPHEKGIGVKENWHKLLEKYEIHTDKTPDMLAKETQDAYLEEIGSLTVRTGFDDFVERLNESGIQIALATSNTWEQTDKILDIIDLQDVFEVVTTSDEVIYNKPDPYLFTVTADKLGVERSDCLVLEDSPAGIEAAKRAGMKVIAITSDDGMGRISKADLIVESFSEITPQVIDQL